MRRQNSGSPATEQGYRSKKNPLSASPLFYHNVRENFIRLKVTPRLAPGGGRVHNVAALQYIFREGSRRGQSAVVDVRVAASVAVRRLVFR